jgi:hypothetical protein
MSDSTLQRLRRQRQGSKNDQRQSESQVLSPPFTALRSPQRGQRLSTTFLPVDSFTLLVLNQKWKANSTVSVRGVT